MPAFPRTVIADGKVVPVQDAHVGLTAGGVVTAVLVQEGDVVDAGALLLQLDDQDAQVAVQQAQADLMRAQARYAELAAGARPEEIAAAEATLAAATARLDRLQLSTANGDIGATRRCWPRPRPICARSWTVRPRRSASSAGQSAERRGGTPPRPTGLQRSLLAQRCGRHPSRPRWRPPPTCSRRRRHTWPIWKTAPPRRRSPRPVRRFARPTNSSTPCAAAARPNSPRPPPRCAAPRRNWTSCGQAPARSNWPRPRRMSRRPRRGCNSSWWHWASCNCAPRSPGRWPPWTWRWASR
ncbi:MAG: efflux RND transporter periplasmic adaptor subunit [Caldilineaceae bacterium]